MAIREILKMGDDRLLHPAGLVPPEAFGQTELLALVQDLWDTMVHANGAGLAAPQIGVPLQVVVFGTGQPNPRYPDAPLVPSTVLCNPVIWPLSADGRDQGELPKNDGWEGCLSVPGLRGLVPRFSHIRYTGHDERGQPLDRTVHDFHARVVQHECDHLWGTLYPMRIPDLRNFGFTEVLFPELI
jgi:peptide deformylase